MSAACGLSPPVGSLKARHTLQQLLALLMATQAAHQLRAAATGWGQAQQPRVSPPSQAPTQPRNQPTPIPVRSDPSSAAAAPPPAAAAPAVSGSARVSLPSFVLRLLLAMLPPCAGDPSPPLFSAAAAASNRSSPGLMFARALWTPLPVRARAGGSPGWRAGGTHRLLSCNSHRAMGGHRIHRREGGTG